MKYVYFTKLLKELDVKGLIAFCKDVGLDGVDLAVRPEPVSVEGEPLTELAFFGRLEERKGVRVFAQALNLLGPKLLDGVIVSFVGREATITRDQVTSMI